MAKEQVYYNFNMKSLCSNGCKMLKASFLGKSYTVVPVSMIVSGAYFPGGGDVEEPQALFFDGKDLEKSKDSWNGRPASLGHPKSGITMNEPDSFDKHWLGFVFNTEYDSNGNRLTAQLWIDDVRGDKVIDKVEHGEEIDVSIGAFGTLEKEEGEFSGIKYSHKYTNIRGDHLAVLPDSNGACSWDDGCGIRAESGVSAEAVIDNEDSKGAIVGKKCDKAESADKVEEKENITCEDVLKNPDKYDSAILDAIKMRDEAKARLVEGLKSIEFDGGPLCNKFLEGMNIQELSSLQSLVSHFEFRVAEAETKPVEKEVVAERAEKRVDYSLTANSASNDDFKLEPAVIEW